MNCDKLLDYGVDLPTSMKNLIFSRFKNKLLEQVSLDFDTRAVFKVILPWDAKEFRNLAEDEGYTTLFDHKAPRLCCLESSVLERGRIFDEAVSQVVCKLVRLGSTKKESLATFCFQADELLKKLSEEDSSEPYDAAITNARHSFNGVRSYVDPTFVAGVPAFQILMSASEKRKGSKNNKFSEIISAIKTTESYYDNLWQDFTKKVGPTVEHIEEINAATEAMNTSDVKSSALNDVFTKMKKWVPVVRDGVLSRLENECEARLGSILEGTFGVGGAAQPHKELKDLQVTLTLAAELLPRSLAKWTQAQQDLAKLCESKGKQGILSEYLVSLKTLEQSALDDPAGIANLLHAVSGVKAQNIEASEICEESKGLMQTKAQMLIHFILHCEEPEKQDTYMDLLKEVVECKLVGDAGLTKIDGAIGAMDKWIELREATDKFMKLDKDLEGRLGQPQGATLLTNVLALQKGMEAVCSKEAPQPIDLAGTVLLTQHKSSADNCKAWMQALVGKSLASVEKAIAEAEAFGCNDDFGSLMSWVPEGLKSCKDFKKIAEVASEHFSMPKVPQMTTVLLEGLEKAIAGYVTTCETVDAAPGEKVLEDARATQQKMVVVKFEGLLLYHYFADLKKPNASGLRRNMRKALKIIDDPPKPLEKKAVRELVHAALLAWADKASNW